MKLNPQSSANMTRFRSGTVSLCALVLLTGIGCSRAPSFSILGSFFPAWILCSILGILLTVVARVLFVRANFEQQLSPLLLIYPCLALLFTFSIWLLFFR